jgi:hypothetical protein
MYQIPLAYKKEYLIFLTMWTFFKPKQLKAFKHQAFKHILKVPLEAGEQCSL